MKVNARENVFPCQEKKSDQFENQITQFSGLYVLSKHFDNLGIKAQFGSPDRTSSRDIVCFMTIFARDAGAAATPRTS